MQTVEDFPHGDNPVDEELQLLRLHLIRGHALLAAQRGVEMVLPAQLVRRVILIWQRDLILAELCDLLLLHVGEELVLAVLDQLLLFPREEVQTDGEESLEGDHEEAGGVGLGGGRLLALLLLGGGAAVGLLGDGLAGAWVARHDQRHRVQLVGRDEVQLLTFEVLKVERKK